MLREDRSYTELEARVLDVALVLHADHGGGNNSTFTNHVVTSSGTDTYSAIAAAMASLKGPRHGGANSKVMAMMDDIRSHVSVRGCPLLCQAPSGGEGPGAGPGPVRKCGAGGQAPAPGAPGAGGHLHQY